VRIQAAQLWTTKKVRHHEQYNPATRRTVSDQPIGASDTEDLLRAATLAPSLHNSQPWAFGVARHHIDVYADASRQLPNADPTGRSLLISCGAAIFNLRVAAEHLGFRPHVRLNPDPKDPTLVAVARLNHRRPRPGPLDRYYPAIARRRTNRRPFRNQHLPYSILAALDEAVRAEGAILRIYDDADEVRRIIDLIHHAELADTNEPGRTTERQAWIGGPLRDDGIPAGSLGPRPLEQPAAYRDLGHAVGIPRDYAQFEATPTIAILSTVRDKPIDWIRAGQSLERLLLDRHHGRSGGLVPQPAAGERRPATARLLPHQRCRASAYDRATRFRRRSAGHPPPITQPSPACAANDTVTTARPLTLEPGPAR
jgi:nitroreductase